MCNFCVQTGKYWSICSFEPNQGFFLTNAGQQLFVHMKQANKWWLLLVSSNQMKKNDKKCKAPWSLETLLETSSKPQKSFELVVIDKIWQRSLAFIFHLTIYQCRGMCLLLIDNFGSYWCLYMYMLIYFIWPFTAVEVFVCFKCITLVAVGASIFICLYISAVGAPTYMYMLLYFIWPYTPV